MPRKLHLLLILLLAVSATGCVTTRLGEKAWNVGVVNHYADFSAIKDGVVYESAGEYYIATKEVSYHPDSNLMGLFGHWRYSRQVPVDATERYTWLKITAEAKGYLCEDMKMKFPMAGEVMLKMTSPPARAVQHSVTRELPPPQVYVACFGEYIVDSQLLYSTKSGSSYLLLPTVVVGGVCDIPGTIIASTLFPFMIPFYSQ